MEENVSRTSNKIFPNGDTYIGDFKEAQPHGKGKYTWSDGTVYEGDWVDGKMTGKGKMSWPSQAKYEGDFSGGYIHGFGTFIACNGSTYTGSLKLNCPHGIGKKKYPNSDVYEGCWREGVQEGSGRYVWWNGNMYTGNWKSGTMSGRGVMKWADGSLFDGFWSNGLRNGSGIYKFADGSYYSGTWSKGLKDGWGIFYPAGCKHHRVNLEGNGDKRKKKPSRSLSLESEESGTPSVEQSFSEKIPSKIQRDSAKLSSKRALLDDDGGFPSSVNDMMSNEISCIITSHECSDDQIDLPGDKFVAYEREYIQGVLAKERVRNISKSSFKIKPQIKFSKEVKRGPFDIFKGQRSYYLMLSLQLGIRYTVGKITPVPKREVRPSDFGKQARIRMSFPRKGSKLTPPHKSINFCWKDYCPLVFRNLRELFKLDAADYMMSICGDDGVRELCSPGKSGSLFYLSQDDRFVIKTLNKSELKTLLKMLPEYYSHVKLYDNTLITKFFGAHSISLICGKKVRFVVMGNMFCTELHIHRRYDLKGSWQGRTTNKDEISESTTLKDLDLEYEFHMDKLLRASLLRQLSLDSNFLKSQSIIDYSLLLGVHFRAPEHLNSVTEDSLHKGERSSPAADGVMSQVLAIPPRGLLLVTHEPGSVSPTPGPHIRGRALIGNREADLLLPGTGRLRVQLGVNMPAQANHKLEQTETASTEIELFEVYDVVLYLGIIDILQDYNLRKKVEHKMKSMKHDPMSISVVKPEVYSKRFISFLEKKFPLKPN